MPSAMDDEEFWALIDLIEGTGWHDETTDLSPLVAALSKREPEEIQAFFETLAQKSHNLATRAHFRRFRRFLGSVDVFLYTRLAVIAQGETEYTRILETPKYFPKSSTNWLEGLLYVADEAYENVTGEEFERMSVVSIEAFPVDQKGN